MAVYVDETFNWPVELTDNPQAKRVAGHTGGLWCHMWADTLSELHTMALMIGLKLEWFQDRFTFPHYDLVPSKRRLALQRGAVERELPDRRSRLLTMEQTPQTAERLFGVPAIPNEPV